MIVAVPFGPEVVAIVGGDACAEGCTDSAGSGAAAVCAAEASAEGAEAAAWLAPAAVAEAWPRQCGMPSRPEGAK
jgi:hypothetical protein